MKVLKLLISPAALCLWAICLSIGFSIVGSDASRTITISQETKFGYAKSSFPIQMKQLDEVLFHILLPRAKVEMAEFLKAAEQEAAARPPEDEAPAWTPHSLAADYVEQFRTPDFISYIEIANVTRAEAQPAIAFRTVNFDKAGNRELGLADLLEGAADRSKALEALSAYATAELKDRTGEEGELESDDLHELTKPDLSIYERFTFCPSTKPGKAAGLTIHFPPASAGRYAGTDFHVTIPYTVFAKFLKPGMKALFSGEPRQAPISVQDASL